MSITEVFFWVSLSILFFCYVGYGMILFLYNGSRRLFTDSRRSESEPELPSVTLIVAAYNEKDTIQRKIANILALDYPREKLHTIFVTDGSTDDSASIVSRYPSIVLLHQQERKGKTAAIKRAMQHTGTPIVVFTDANTDLNDQCIRRMVEHYADPGVGGVAGEKKIVHQAHLSAVGQAEGIYWKYESFMKKLDADFNTVVGAAGELFSIRTDLFSWPDDDVILDDFVISMTICLRGFRIEYEPLAFATEFPSASLAEEEKRKVRISAGAYQSIHYLKSGLDFFRHPLLSFQFVSRRLLRWVFCPAMLIVLLLTNLLLAGKSEGPGIYTIFLYCQLSFYFIAVIGWFLIYLGSAPGVLTVPFYFVFMNYCLVKGFGRFITGRQTVLWEKSVRQTTS